MNYDDAISLITSKNNFYIDLGLGRIRKVLSVFGNPQEDLNFIHVAGTNGKGSVCAILASILKEAGYKVGLYTSPHIKDYTERIQINGEKISKQDFADLVQEIVNVNIHLTEFEILTVCAFLYFKKQKTNVVILETGLGGRLDATNVISKNLCSVITHIDLDHTDRLGDTKDKIAYEKAGIIKPNCPVITSMKYKAIEDKVKDVNSSIIFPNISIEKKYVNSLALKGLNQIENLVLVMTVINNFFKNISDEVVINGLKKVNHPCRFEYKKDKNLIIDGAHNPNGIEALRANLDYYFPNQKRRFIFGCLRTKDYEVMMKNLFREGDEIYLNGFDYPNACTYDELKLKCPYPAFKYQPTMENNITQDKLNIICGSFYMIGKMNISNL